jgi:transposase InsO family protein
LQRRRRPGFFEVQRPDQLWHLDMTSVWVAEHGWVYLMAAIDRCTREIVAWHLKTRCRAKEAIGLIERAATERGIPPGTLTLGTDNGSAFTARALQGRPGRPGDHAPPRRLPRPREPSVHRVLVRQAQGALRLAARVRDPRRS